MPLFYQGGDFTLFATDPRVQVWPQTTFRYFSFTGLSEIPGGGSQVVLLETTVVADNSRWLLGSNNVLSFAIKKDQFSGALLVEIDPGDGTYNDSFIFPLSGESIMDTLTGFEIGGLAARFQVINGAGPACDCVGWIQLRSW